MQSVHDRGCFARAVAQLDVVSAQLPGADGPQYRPGGIAGVHHSCDAMAVHCDQPTAARWRDAFPAYLQPAASSTTHPLNVILSFHLSIKNLLLPGRMLAC